MTAIRIQAIVEDGRLCLLSDVPLVEVTALGCDTYVAKLGNPIVCVTHIIYTSDGHSNIERLYDETCATRNPI